MTLIHLEPEEFVETLYARKGSLKTEAIVLDNGVAGMVYLFQDHADIYYLDRLFAGRSIQMSEQERHAEMYRKVALVSHSRPAA
jgi:hypothetical protein